MFTANLVINGRRLMLRSDGRCFTYFLWANYELKHCLNYTICVLVLAALSFTNFVLVLQLYNLLTITNLELNVHLFEG